MSRIGWCFSPCGGALRVFSAFPVLGSQSSHVYTLSRLRTVFLLIILLPLCFITIASAEEPSVASSLAATPPVILSASEYDYPPYCLVSTEGQADGFSVELLRAALKAMGRDVSFQVGPWSEVKQLLVDGQVQVLPLVGRTPERERDFDFTFPYLTMHGTIVVRDDETAIFGLDDLKNKRVAVMQNDNAEEFLRRIKLDATILTTSTFEEALRQLSDGQHDAVVIQKLLALRLMQRLNLTNLKTSGPPLNDFVQSFCFAVKKGDDKLLSILNEGLSIVIADGTFRLLSDKWFGPIEAIELKKSRIVIGGDSDYPPYEFLDKNGQPAGYNVDLTHAIARQMGLDVEIRLRPWAEIRMGLAEDKIDAVQGMFYSLERDQSFDFSPAHTLISHVIVAREGAELPLTMADLTGQSILVMEGDIMHDAAVKLGYAGQLVLVKSQEEALNQLANGQHDIALVAKIPALYWINKHGWNNLRISEQPVLAPEYCFAVPHGNSALLARLSEGLKAIRETGEYRQIYSAWLGVYERPRLDAWTILRYSLVVVVPFTVLLIISMLWSWTLKNKIQKATVQLQKEIAGHRMTYEDLHAKNEEMERFLYMVSHDLKSPVVTIKGFLSLLDNDLKSGDEQAIATDLMYINKATDRLKALLDDLLEIARIGKVADSKKECTFTDLAHTALDLVAGMVASKQVEVVIAAADVRLCGDYSRLLEIWQNLLENAVKYMGEQVSPRIEVGVEEQGPDVVFCVRDNGAGINPLFHKKIFDLFEKLDRNSEGTGLGLALVTRIVEHNKGRIWVESKGEGQGSCFFFTLPATLMNVAVRKNAIE